MANAFCQDCFFYCATGMNFELDADLEAYYYPLYVDKLKLELSAVSWHLVFGTDRSYWIQYDGNYVWRVGVIYFGLPLSSSIANNNGMLNSRLYLISQLTHGSRHGTHNRHNRTRNHAMTTHETMEIVVVIT